MPGLHTLLAATHGVCFLCCLECLPLATALLQRLGPAGQMLCGEAEEIGAAGWHKQPGAAARDLLESGSTERAGSTE